MTERVLVLPEFDTINLETFIQQLDDLLGANLKQIEELVSQGDITWDSLILPMSELEDKVQKLWSPVSHMHSVVSSDSLRKVYAEGLEKLTNYGNTVGQNSKLYQAYKILKASQDWSHEEAKLLNDAIVEFELSGVGLSESDKETYKTTQQALSKAQTKFSENVLDATDSWSYSIEDEALLSGLPEYAKQMAKMAAEEKSEAGYCLTLSAPCYIAVMTYADNRELRETVYRAYSTRASEFNLEKLDNGPLLAKIVKLKQSIAKLLGYQHYAERSLVQKMVSTPQQVTQFLEDLLERSKGQADKEYQALCEFAVQQGLEGDIELWDLAYYTEKQKQSLFDISEEALRVYFPEDKVMNGLFSLVHKLYGLTFQQREVSVWHKDAKYFDLLDESGDVIAGCYVDLYARANKKSGAWMDDYCGRWRLADGRLQLPVAYVTCNFAGPTENKPALFSHQEVVTLFHEFGHALHHMLTEVEYLPISGINGVEWDAVELPSQYMENWCWEPSVLPMFSGHYETDDPLPMDMLQKLIDGKNFQSAIQMVRQLIFSLFDFEVYSSEQELSEQDIQAMLDAIRIRASVLPTDPNNRFQNSFSHIFDGGYSAGYFSYKWAEVLSSDVFAKFEEDGLFDAGVGARLLKTILSKGGSKPAAELFADFRGRAPQIDALLRHNAIL